MIEKGNPMIKEQYLVKSVLASIHAGDAILEVYHSDFAIEHKADKSPLTMADKRSHDIINRYLSEYDIPILSEEGRSIPYAQRKVWDTLWIVDPLDGTKEFVKRNDEFTVNIALVENQIPILGVILVPVKNTLYFAARDIGAYKCDLNQVTLKKDVDVNTLIEHSQLLPINHAGLDKADGITKKKSVTEDEKHPYTIVGSRSHATPELEAFVEDKRKAFGRVEFISAGSSLKFCLIAEGQADIYPRLGPTMEWDTAAGQVIAEYAGAKVHRYDTGKSLLYNKEDLLNPWFIVEKGNRIK